jgi:signal transduction histidine kinase
VWGIGSCVRVNKMRSLWFRLIGAFALVIFIGVVANSVLIDRATGGQFSRYVTQSGKTVAQRLAPVLADEYAQDGGWQNAEAWLESTPQPGVVAPGVGPHMGGMMGRGPAASGSAGGVTQHMMMSGVSGDMWATMGVRLMLADESGVVVADTLGSFKGTSLKPSDLTAGTPVVVAGRQVGTLLAVLPDVNVVTPASDFLHSVNRSTWLASVAAGVLALVLGMLLFRQIVAPIRALTRASERIAAGQLDQRVMVTSKDELGQLGAAFNQMADALARDRELQRNMIADVAHELRTPLTAIQGNLEAILDGVLPMSAQEVSILHDETLLLARLVADLRLLSLAESGQLKLELAPLDVADLAGRVVERMRPQAEGGGVELAVEAASGLPKVEADGDRITQVISNLVGNGLRHTPPGGRVTVSVAQGPAGGAVVSVTDSGSGIAAEDLPHVFDRFYRADRSRNRASGGSGLGLAIVKQLVEAHGGDVRVASEPGRETRFSFTLPASVGLAAGGKSLRRPPNGGATDRPNDSVSSGIA